MAAGRMVSGAIVASLIPQKVMGGNPTRRGLIVQNRSTTLLTLKSTGDILNADGMEVPPRTEKVLTGIFTPLGDVFLVSAAAGSAFSVLEGTGTDEEAGPSGLFPFDGGGSSANAGATLTLADASGSTGAVSTFGSLDGFGAISPGLGRRFLRITNIATSGLLYVFDKEGTPILGGNTFTLSPGGSVTYDLRVPSSMVRLAGSNAGMPYEAAVGS